jgi:hypothetical protein
MDPTDHFGNPSHLTNKRKNKMPKRITRTERERQSIFLSGFNCGVSATFFGLQLTALRKGKNKTIPEVAVEIGIPEKHLKGLEAGNCFNFMSLDLDQLSTISKYFDVAVDVCFKSHNAVEEPLAEKISVPTFEEEYHAG